VIFVVDATGEEHEYDIPHGTHLAVQEGQTVSAGDQLNEGSLNPHDILRIKGETALQNYMVQEVQKVYRSQGVDINDKHVEVIVRSMMRKVKIVEGADTLMLPGQVVEAAAFGEANDRIKAENLEPATANPVLLGVTKASLATESFLSAASFQETTRVLTDAAIKGKYDPLLGLKENVIIGKLIPAGTGMSRYRNIEITPKGQDVDDDGRPRTQQVEMNGYQMTADDAALAEVMAGGGDGMSRLMSAYERNREPLTVQYEGEYDDHLAVHAAPKKTQYDRIKGINPEDL
jgi:DNA-directed RNA polymerase subunit beta'